MVSLNDLQTYIKVKDYIEENDITIEDLLRSFDDKVIPVMVSRDGISKKFYSLHSAAKHMGVSLARVKYSKSKGRRYSKEEERGSKSLLCEVELKLTKFPPTNKMGVLNQNNFDLSKFKVREVKGDKFKRCHLSMKVFLQ